MIRTAALDIDSSGNFTVVNITEQVREFVTSSGIVHGQVLVFYKHTTGAVLIAEHDAGIIADLQDVLERISPVDYKYIHHLKGVDFNGHAHVRSALLTVSVTIPILNGDMLLGQYQEILVIDDQTDPAPRQVVVQVIGA
jgi:secondary thiamine-phosphate synthase enzyme